jgi:hypothetical protein
VRDRLIDDVIKAAITVSIARLSGYGSPPLPHPHNRDRSNQPHSIIASAARSRIRASSCDSSFSMAVRINIDRVEYRGPRTQEMRPPPELRYPFLPALPLPRHVSQQRRARIAGARAGSVGIGHERAISSNLLASITQHGDDPSLESFLGYDVGGADRLQVNK